MSMKLVKTVLEPWGGSSFRDCAVDAIEESIGRQCLVEFTFNDAVYECKFEDLEKCVKKKDSKK